MGDAPPRGTMFFLKGDGCRSDQAPGAKVAPVTVTNGQKPCQAAYDAIFAGTGTIAARPYHREDQPGVTAGPEGIRRSGTSKEWDSHRTLNQGRPPRSIIQQPGLCSMASANQSKLARFDGRCAPVVTPC